MKTDKDVITFWFEELTPKQWFAKSDALDNRIKTDYLAVYEQAIAENLNAWHARDEGRLAEIIVLDQFSRNMFRDQAAAFAHDELALQRSNEAVQAGVMQRLPQNEGNFILMPFMHSESLAVHQAALPVFEQYASSGTLSYEHKHRAIIERFGRYPHRNKMLGRESTTEEIKFLSQPNSSF